MFKKLIVSSMMALIAISMGISACAVQAAPASSEIQTVPVVESVLVDSAANVSAPSTLTAEETAGLLYMYEEEKLARDVYNILFTQWGQPIFQSIASSEQKHMDAIYTLLVRYGVAVPTSAAGIFTDPALQSLYENLIKTGSQSLADALKVGAIIEEVDIADLQSRLAVTTSADIQRVYNNLMNGSYNHLRNYVRILDRLTGETYQPQYLDADLYQTIVSSSNGNGYGYNANATDGGRGFRGGK